MNKLHRLSQMNLFLCLFVIIWGAWVRRTHSGAGCGEHWPLCNGEIVPLSPSLNTFIEFTHRLSSGFFGLLILYTLFCVFKSKQTSRALRLSIVGAFLFTFIEAFIGAVLVKKGLVLDNQSSTRAILIAFHLVNTFFLLATLTGTFFFSHPHLQKSTIKPLPLKPKESIVFGLLFLSLIWLGASGAIAALGNTLFPVTDGLQALHDELNTQSHFLIQLRLYHPASAILVVTMSLALLTFGFPLRQNDNRFLFGKQIVITLFFTGLMIGLINLFLHAPNITALLHLLWADLIWISLCHLYLVGKMFHSPPLDF